MVGALAHYAHVARHQIAELMEGNVLYVCVEGFASRGWGEEGVAFAGEVRVGNGIDRIRRGGNGRDGGGGGGCGIGGGVQTLTGGGTGGQGRGGRGVFVGVAEAEAGGAAWLVGLTG